jgi:hypothetical protein
MLTSLEPLVAHPLDHPNYRPSTRRFSVIANDPPLVRKVRAIRLIGTSLKESATQTTRGMNLQFVPQNCWTSLSRRSDRGMGRFALLGK